MEHLDFITWMLLWPIAVSVDGLITAKTRQITGESHIKGNLYVVLINIITWFVIAKILY